MVLVLDLVIISNVDVFGVRVDDSILSFVFIFEFLDLDSCEFGFQSLFLGFVVYCFIKF